VFGGPEKRFIYETPGSDAFVDYDEDGLLDIYLGNGAPDPRALVRKPPISQSRQRRFRRRDGCERRRRRWPSPSPSPIPRPTATPIRRRDVWRRRAL
jgi:hypothetical protein